MITSSVKRLIRSVRARGIAQTILHVPAAVASRMPSAIREREADSARDRNVDIQYGIDTVGNIDAVDLHTDSPNKLFSVRYQPIRSEDFFASMAAIPRSLDGFTFVDFGSGKGRALVLACKFPFRRIVGVEFCEDLHAAAMRNVSGMRADCSTGAEFDLVCGDALKYELPSEPLVLFFYNPFGVQVMAPLVGRIEESLRKNPREAYIVYCKPECINLFNESRMFARVAEQTGFAVFASRAIKSNPQGASP